MNTKDYFKPLHLRSGAGGSYENGLCVMEAVSWLSAEGATDAPKCACPVLGRFAIRINDMLDDENRQKLSRLILPLTGTRSPEHERQRADYLVAQVSKRIVPMWFERAGMSDWANRMRKIESAHDVAALMSEARKDAADAADARQPMLIASIEILDEAIKLGPNGYDAWPQYEARAEQLVTFAKEKLGA